MTLIPHVPDWATGLVIGVVGITVLQLIYRALTAESAKGKIVYITGGSEGIGKSMAADLVARGAHVVILARRAEVLQKAAEDIEKAVEFGGSISWSTMDVTAIDSVEKCVAGLVAKHGAPDYLILSAGASYPGYFLEQPVEDFAKCMQLNYMGTVNVIKRTVPHMISNGGGRIMIVSSAAGVVSLIGYGSYSPTKYALRGLGDCLRSELNGFNVKVCVCYPPDTDTPGFAKENESKPKETLACFPADPYPAQAVARQSISSMLKGDYHIQSVDLLQNLLVSHASAITPRAFFLHEAVLQPLLCLAAVPFYKWFDYQARCYAKRHLGK
eukprot:gene14069-21535_t